MIGNDLMNDYLENENIFWPMSIIGIFLPIASYSFDPDRREMLRHARVEPSCPTSVDNCTKNPHHRRTTAHENIRPRSDLLQVRKPLLSSGPLIKQFTQNQKY